MTRLRQIQIDLQAYLLGAPNAAAQHVTGTDHLGADARLQVYADAYRIRLREALEHDFKALHAWLGDERFAELAHAYIAAHPSTSYSLRWLGRQLARFLAETAAYAATPFLAELAAFEWALASAFDAPDEPALRREQLAALPPADWPRLRFRPHASVVRLDLHWNAPAIRKAVEAGEQSLPASVMSTDAKAWVVWRQDLKTFFRSLELDEADAFDALRVGGSFASVCEGLSRNVPADEVPVRAAQLLERWLAQALVSGYSLDP